MEPRQKQGMSRVHMLASLGKSVSSSVSAESQNVKWRDIETDTRHQPLASTCVQAHVHLTHMHIPTDTCTPITETHTQRERVQKRLHFKVERPVGILQNKKKQMLISERNEAHHRDKLVGSHKSHLLCSCLPLKFYGNVQTVIMNK